MFLGRFILQAGFHFDGDSLIAHCTDQYLGMMEFLLVSLDLLWGERTKAFFVQPAHKECAVHTAIAALDTAVERQAVKDTFLVAYNSGRFSKGVNGLDAAAHDFLHFMQAADLFFIGREVWFYD